MAMAMAMATATATAKAMAMAMELAMAGKLQPDAGAGSTMTGKVTRVKQTVASLAVSSDSGISAYSNRGTKSIGSPLRVGQQVWLFLLVIFASAKQVNSCVVGSKEKEGIGSCRFDLTSIATLSCVEPDGKWRPPSVSCCQALLSAIDHLPFSNESGACCLCRYLKKIYSGFELPLATSYVLCRGKDSNIVAAWSSHPLPCHKACHQGNASSHSMDTPTTLTDFRVVDVEVTEPGYFKMLIWIAIMSATAFCAMFLVRICYHKWYSPRPLNLENRGLPGEKRDERRTSRKKSSAHRRLSSSRGSPNG